MRVTLAVPGNCVFGVVVIVAVLFVPLALMSIFSSRASAALFHNAPRLWHTRVILFVCCASFELHRVSVVISCRLLDAAYSLRC